MVVQIVTPRIQRQCSVSTVEDEFAWLKLLEGEKKGLEFAIYGDHTTLGRLRQADEVTLTIESQNQRNTKWKIVSVDAVESYS